MKKFGLILTLIALGLSPVNALAAGPGWQGEHFSKIFYFYGAAGKGSLSGLSAGNAKPIADTDIMSIEAGTVITNVMVIIDTAITGSSAIDIGDDDDADGFCPTAALTLGTAGLYCPNAKVQGVYLRVQTAGATDAGDIYVVPTKKYYSASGKEIKLDNTTTNTGGAFRVIVEGYKVGA